MQVLGVCVWRWEEKRDQERERVSPEQTSPGVGDGLTFSMSCSLSLSLSQSHTHLSWLMHEGGVGAQSKLSALLSGRQWTAVTRKWQEVSCFARVCVGGKRERREKQREREGRSSIEGVWLRKIVPTSVAPPSFLTVHLSSKLLLKKQAGGQGRNTSPTFILAVGLACHNLVPPQLKLPLDHRQPG